MGDLVAKADAAVFTSEISLSGSKMDTPTDGSARCVPWDRRALDDGDFDSGFAEGMPERLLERNFVSKAGRPHFCSLRVTLGSFGIDALLLERVEFLEVAKRGRQVGLELSMSDCAWYQDLLLGLSWSLG